MCSATLRDVPDALVRFKLNSLAGPSLPRRISILFSIPGNQNFWIFLFLSIDLIRTSLTSLCSYGKLIEYVRKFVETLSAEINSVAFMHQFVICLFLLTEK